MANYERNPFILKSPVGKGCVAFRGVFQFGVFQTTLDLQIGILFHWEVPSVDFHSELPALRTWCTRKCSKHSAFLELVVPKTLDFRTIRKIPSNAPEGHRGQLALVLLLGGDCPLQSLVWEDWPEYWPYKQVAHLVQDISPPTFWSS